MPNELPVGLIEATSLSFYLALRVLPAAARPQIGLAYRLVPKGQPDISQPQGGWYRSTKYIPSRRDGGNIRTSIPLGDFHRPFRTNFLSDPDQTLRVWLISCVASRHQTQRMTGENLHRALQTNRVCPQPI